MRQNVVGRWQVGEGLQVLLGLWLILGVCSFHETLLMPVHMYGTETMILKEKERSRIRDAQMDSLSGLLGIRRMEKV